MLCHIFDCQEEPKLLPFSRLSCVQEEQVTPNKHLLEAKRCAMLVEQQATHAPLPVDDEAGLPQDANIIDNPAAADDPSAPKRLNTARYVECKQDRLHKFDCVYAKLMF